MISSATALTLDLSKQGDKADIDLKLYPGWNLIQQFTIPNFDCSQKETPNQVCKDDIAAAYSYWPVMNKYFLAYPESDIYFTDDELKIAKGVPKEYMDNMGMFIYLKGDSEKTYTYKHAFDSSWVLDDTFKLFKGWNIITILPQMADKKFSDFKGDCDITGVYMFNGDDQKWIDLSKILESNEFSLEIAGAGLVLKTSKDCTLNFVETKISSPPALPN